MIILQIEEFSAYCEEACMKHEVKELIRRTERDDYEKIAQNLRKTIKRVSKFSLSFPSLFHTYTLSRKHNIENYHPLALVFITDSITCRIEGSF